MRHVGKTAAQWLAEHKARPTNWFTDAVWRMHRFMRAERPGVRSGMSTGPAEALQDLFRRVYEQGDGPTRAWCADCGAWPGTDQKCATCRQIAAALEAKR